MFLSPDRKYFTRIGYFTDFPSHDVIFFRLICITSNANISMDLDKKIVEVSTWRTFKRSSSLNYMIKLHVRKHRFIIRVINTTRMRYTVYKHTELYRQTDTQEGKQKGIKFLLTVLGNYLVYGRKTVTTPV